MNDANFTDLPLPVVAAYGRISGQRQITDTKEDVQIKIDHVRADLSAVALAELGLTLDTANIQVDSYTGSRLADRPALLSILADCRTGRIDTLVLMDTDRLARNKSDRAIIQEVFFSREIKIVTRSLTVRHNDSYESTMMAHIKSILGE